MVPEVHWLYSCPPLIVTTCGRRLTVLLAVWIWNRRLSHISRWRIDMFKLRRCFLVTATDGCLLLVGFR